MTSYRLQVMNEDHVVTVRTLDCSDDAAAILAITIHLDAEPPHHSAEMWQNDRLVWRIPRRYPRTGD